MAENWRIEDWFPELEEEVLRKLKIYHGELLHFNKTINLVSQKTEKNADDLHFADAILGSQIVLNDTKHKTIYDIGSGNGIPGMVLAILDPAYQLVLVDRDVRKCEFLKLAARRIELSNIVVLNSPVEKLRDDSIECAISRGFANLSKTFVMTRNKLRAGADYYHFKSDSWFREVADIPSQLSRYFSPSLLADYHLPASNARLSIIKAVKKY